MNLPKRKHPRLKGYDYSQNGCYFVTVCVKDKRQLLGSVHVGRDAHIPPTVELSETGKVAEKYIQNINFVYDNISVENYVIMPNHIHFLFLFYEEPSVIGGMKASRPTLFTVIRSFKTMVTKEIGYSVWQDSYFDEIIDSENGYLEAWRYIDENPLKWTLKKGEDY
ncbi:MAG: transposase [Clostridia bacterium]|nr:transposase [Clostridia bacterium]